MRKKQFLNAERHYTLGYSMQRPCQFLLLLNMLYLFAHGAAATQAVLAGVWPKTTVTATTLPKTPVIDRYGRAEVVGEQPALLAAGKVVMDGSIEHARWRAAEHEARGARRGLWRTLPILSADKAEGHAGEFALVRGKVVGTYQSREDWYVNFGENWKNDFTLRIPRRYWKKFPNPEMLVGKHIEARGVLHMRNGPMITLQFPGQMVVE